MLVPFKKSIMILKTFRERQHLSGIYYEEFTIFNKILQYNALSILFNDVGSVGYSIKSGSLEKHWWVCVGSAKPNTLAPWETDLSVSSQQPVKLTFPLFYEKPATAENSRAEEAVPPLASLALCACWFVSTPERVLPEDRLANLPFPH